MRFIENAILVRVLNYRLLFQKFIQRYYVKDMVKILAFANDAGGANILAYLIKYNLQPKIDWSVAAPTASPADFIFKKILKTKKLKRLRWRKDFSFLAKHKFDLVLVTTGHGGFELKCLQAAKKQKLTTAALLDHWQNYRERFGYPERGWQKNLPDHILVGDSLSWKLSKEAGFKNLLKIKNYYLFDLLQQKDKFTKRQTGGDNLLFLSETLVALSQGSGQREQHSELKILEELLTYFTKLKKEYGVKKLVIRLHPGEIEKNKYNFLKKQYPTTPISIESGRTSFFSSLQSSALVVGRDTIALFIACLLGKLTVSFNPDKIKTTLPLPNNYKITKISQFFKIKKIDKVKFLQQLLYGEPYDFKNILTKALSKNKLSNFISAAHHLGLKKPSA